MECNCSYENPINFDLDKDTYQLNVPNPITIYNAEGAYEIVASGIIQEENNLFNCITSYEDYVSVVGHYVKQQMHMFSSSIRVLVLYYDQELALHATMPLWVSIHRLDEVPVNDVPYAANRRVQSYQEWTMNN